MKTYAERIKAARKRLGITQARAAALCGVSLRTWSHWERGARLPLPPTRDGVLGRLRRRDEAT